MTRNNLNKRVIQPTGELADFLRLDDEMTPLEFTSLLWSRLYQSGSVRNSEDGTRAHRRRKREREAAKRRRLTTR